MTSPIKLLVGICAISSTSALTMDPRDITPRRTSTLEALEEVYGIENRCNDPITKEKIGLSQAEAFECFFNSRNYDASISGKKLIPRDITGFLNSLRNPSQYSCFL